MELKVACENIGRYRDALTATMTRFAIIRAVVSLCALGTWAAAKSYPMIRGGIIAGAQVADALQNAVPFAARLRGTNALSAALDPLFIECEVEWEGVYAGKLDEGEITRRWHRMKKLRHEAEAKCLPNGLPVRKSLLRLAQADATAYFTGMRLNEGS